MDHREAEPASRLLGRIERLEDAAHCFGIDPRATVADRELHRGFEARPGRAAGIRGERHDDLATDSRGLRTVEQQVLDSDS